MKYKIWIIEDKNEILEGMNYLLGRASFENEVLSFPNGEEAVLALLNKPKPDLILLDLGLPGMSGLQTLVQIKKYWIEVKILIFTIFDDNKNVFEALKYGASGYILKKEDPDSILDSIIEVLNNGAPMSREIAVKVLKSFNQELSNPSYNILSEREQTVLDELALGFLNKEIAEKLNISINTVRNHIASIYTKLHVQNRSEAIIKYLTHN